MDMVLPCLYLGGAAAEERYEELKERGITHVLQVRLDWKSGQLACGISRTAAGTPDCWPLAWWTAVPACAWTHACWPLPATG
jgi:hypothetical protein